MVIADDEAPARRRITAGLAEAEGVQVVAECKDGWDAVRAVRKHAPDIVFLDVQMPGLDGFGVVAEVGVGLMPEVIFVTAHDEYALQAFDSSALDYVLKPFEDARLLNALDRARDHLEKDAAWRRERLQRVARHTREEPNEGTPWIRRFTVRDERDSIHFVRASSVDWIEADGNYVTLHVGAETHRTRATMSGLEEVLDPRLFTRIHRSTIVNVDRVREVHRYFWGDYMATLDSGQELRVSRRYSAALLDPDGRGNGDGASRGS